MQKVLDFLNKRAFYYKAVFDKENTGTLPVLADLAKFCRADKTCVVPSDSRATYVLEGRREVWLRIQNHLNLSQEELYRIYAAKGKDL